MPAMETNVGAGAGQAIESAYILAKLLTHSSISRATIPQALQGAFRVSVLGDCINIRDSAYNKSRLQFTQDVVRQTHYAGRLFEFNEGPSPFEPSDKAWQEKWGKEVSQMWDFQMHAGEAEKCWRETEKYMHENLAELEATS